jgi:hypothetical protein
MTGSASEVEDRRCPEPRQYFFAWGARALCRYLTERRGQGPLVNKPEAIAGLPAEMIKTLGEASVSHQKLA